MFNLKRQTGVCQLLILANSPSQFYVNNVGYAYTADNFADVLGGHDLTYACQNLLTESLNNPQNTVPYVGQKLPMSDLDQHSQNCRECNDPPDKLGTCCRKNCREKHGPRFYSGRSYIGDECAQTRNVL